LPKYTSSLVTTDYKEGVIYYQMAPF
jgi:hypothetical protein